MDLIRRAGSGDGEMDELQAGMSEALDESIAEEIRAAVEIDLEAATAELPVIEPEMAAAKPEAEEPKEQPAEVPAVAIAETGPRLTAYAQSRLAALESFEKLYRDTQEHLQQIEGRLSEITTSQQLTRRFFTIL